MTEKEKENTARVIMEAHALAYAVAVAEPERAKTCADLAGAAIPLYGWLRAVAREVETAPAVPLPALWAVLNRADLDPERAALAAAGVTLEKLTNINATDGRRAYDAALAGTKQAGEVRCMKDAAADLAAAIAATDPAERARRRDAALDELHRADRDADQDGTLADDWQAHLEAMKAPDPEPDVVLRLDARRGEWAGWVNRWLGERNGLEPGQNIFIGGAWGAGKTSIGALFAVDALAQNCPVLFWQLELSRAETLGHLQAQRPDLYGWPSMKFRDRCFKALPETWADLLDVPRRAKPEAGEIIKAMQNQARAVERAEHAGHARHKCRGLVIVDYAQLLTLADAAPKNAQHDILCTAASRLAKAAADCGACLVLLSQINKQDQRDAKAGGTVLAGADLARMADRVALLQKADKDGDACKDGGKPVDFQKGKGERRLMTWHKVRGVRHNPDGTPPPDYYNEIWFDGQSRALHGGDAVTWKDEI